MTIRLMTIISRMNVGGPAVLITELANAFPESDIEHLLVTGVCESNEIDYLDTHPIKGRVKYLRSVRRSIFFLADLKSFFLLVREIRNFRPHIIHTHTTKAGVLGRLAAALSSRTARVVHTYHGHLLYGYFSQWKVLIVVMIEKLMAKLSSILVAVSIQVRDDLLRVKVGKRSQWRVIRPGVIPGKSISRSQGRKELSVSENAFLIAWVGRFTDIKNPELAIRAVEHLAAGREVILIMAGDGELLEKCKKYSKEKDLPVEFLGWVNDINSLLWSADLLLMTSRNEGLPVAMIEAGIRGVPTMSTDVGGVRDFIEDGVSGLLVTQDEIQISRKILDVMDEPSKLLNLGNGAKNVCESKFSINQFVDSHIAMYRELMCG